MLGRFSIVLIAFSNDFDVSAEVLNALGIDSDAVSTKLNALSFDSNPLVVGAERRSVTWNT